MSSIPLVLVSGVSGYIGSWVSYTLLKLGYRVRGTVRSLSNEKKIAHLRDLCPGSEFKIELVEADLNSDKGWDAAVAGCTYVLHVASPFPISSPKNKEELIRPAVDGTLHVLRAVSNASPMPKRVIVTSSFASIGYGQTCSASSPFNEDNWTITDDPANPIDAYTESKVLAERAAWDFLKSLPEDKKFELATVNPTLVQGPMLSANGCSSADIPKQILTGSMPALVDMDIFVTHIYDVVKVHILAMTHKAAPNNRFLLCSGVLSFIEYGKVLDNEFKQYNYSCTLRQAPKWLVWALSWVDAQSSLVYPTIGKRVYIKGKNVENILNYKIVDGTSDIIKAMAHAAIANGIIEDKSNDKSLTSNYVRPEIDLTGIPRAAPM